MPYFRTEGCKDRHTRTKRKQGKKRNSCGSLSAHSGYLRRIHKGVKQHEEKRKIYVGMTRAKSELYIHSNTELFDNYRMDDVVHI